MPRCIAPWRVSTIASSSKGALSIGQSTSALPIATIRKGSSVSLGCHRGRRSSRPRVLEVGDVEFLDQGEMRDAALRLLHILGDLAAQADDLDRFVGAPCAAARGKRCRRCREVCVEIGMADAVARRF